jgi:hypothetical protein
LPVAKATGDAVALSLSALRDWIAERRRIRLIDAVPYGGYEPFYALEADVLLFAEFPDAVSEVRRFFGLDAAGPAGVAIFDAVTQLIRSTWWPFPVQSASAGFSGEIGTLFDVRKGGDFKEQAAYADDAIGFVRQSARIDCVHLREQTAAHRRVEAIAGVAADGNAWRMTVGDAVAGIEQDRCRFHVAEPQGMVTEVGVVTTSSGDKYLDTITRTGRRSIALHELPECRDHLPED